MIRHALLFAAGRGARMRPLTDATPKPLLEVGGKPLIEHHLERCAAAGIRQVVINTSHLAAQFPAVLGDGRRWGLAIHYSEEGPEPLETGGGMLRALPWLGDAFLAASSDVLSDIDLGRIPPPVGDAHLVLVANPAFHPDGDFWLDGGQVNLDGRGERLTFANVGSYRPGLLAGCQPGRFALRGPLRAAIRAGRVSGERHEGMWFNLGTPAQLEHARARWRG